MYFFNDLLATKGARDTKNGSEDRVSPVGAFPDPAAAQSLLTTHNSLGAAPALTIGSVSVSPGEVTSVAISLAGQGRKACAVNGTILYDVGVILNPSVSDAGIALGKRVKFWRKAAGELHFIIFSDIPAAFAGGGAAGDVARLEFRVSPAAVPGWRAGLRWSATFPGDGDYEGVRGTAVCDVDGVSQTPAMVNGKVTVLGGPTAGQVVDYLLGRSPAAPAYSDQNVDGRIDIGDVVRLRE